MELVSCAVALLGTESLGLLLGLAHDGDKAFLCKAQLWNTALSTANFWLVPLLLLHIKNQIIKPDTSHGNWSTPNVSSPPTALSPCRSRLSGHPHTCCLQLRPPPSLSVPLLRLFLAVISQLIPPYMNTETSWDCHFKGLLSPIIEASPPKQTVLLIKDKQFAPDCGPRKAIIWSQLLADVLVSRRNSLCYA